jgi:HPt (histidine-containing phosphotransfer) domain-containing protein
MMDPEFDDLKREFLSEAQLKARDISEAMQSQTPQALERMGYLAHQLKGAGGSYGFQAISSEAAAIEQAVERLVKGPEPQLEALIRERIDGLTAEIESRSNELRIED